MSAADLQSLLAIDGPPAEMIQLCATPGQSLGAAAAWDWLLPRLRSGVAAARNEGREEGLVAGFANCEALVVVMLTAMARDYMRRACDGEDFRVKAQALTGAALAAQLGQHRTDAPNPEAILDAHRRAVNASQASAGGKASAAKMSPAARSERSRKASASMTAEQRSERGRRASRARWAKLQVPEAP